MSFTALFSIIYGLIVLFYLIFTFIYSTFSDNFSVLVKQVVSKHTLKYFNAIILVQKRGIV